MRLCVPVLLLALTTLQSAPLAGQSAARRLEHDVRRLAEFGTRHTLSDTVSATRGIGAARRWLHAELAAISAECGGCLEVRYQRVMLDSGVTARIDRPFELVNVLAIRRAADPAAPFLVVQAHYDSRASDGMDATSDAPGANDDGSGTALVLEAARAMSRAPAPGKSLVFALLAGEEQGLLGGRALATMSRDSGWTVEAVLNNDVVGNVHGSGGHTDSIRVRVFSAPFSPGADERAVVGMVALGGESDGPARQLARYVERAAEAAVPGVDIDPIFRRDRYGRGGDHIPWTDLGVAAVRFTEARENYARQHQDVRDSAGVAYGDVADRMDFQYLARVTASNVAVLAALAGAPPPPEDARVSGAVSSSTTVRWAPVPGASGYRVAWRPTTAPRWTESQEVGDVSELTLPGVLIDDHYFGVAAIGPGGEGLVSFARPGR